MTPTPLAAPPDAPPPRAAHGAAEIGRAAGLRGRQIVRAGRRWLRRDGAEASGLAALTELCITNAVADTLVAVSLAGTVFFNVPIGQARGRVALYLLTTMAPFALLAPVIGPVLDRLHGRRVAMAASMLARAVLCFLLASRLTGLEIYPLALGVLVLSRAFAVTRSAALPRVLPPRFTLMTANSRITIAGAVVGGVVAPLGLGVQVLIGPGWTLRLASLVFVLSAGLTRALPPTVDRDDGEHRADGLPAATAGARGAGQRLGGLPRILRTVLPARALVGYLTLFLAFRLYASTGSSKSAIAEIGVAALVGQGIGIGIGNRLGRRRPEPLVLTGLLVLTGTLIVGAVTYTQTTALVVSAVAVLSASLGKLGLDAVIQRDVPEDTRSSAFARSETALQLAWVAGGSLGLLPVSGTVGFGLAAVAMVLAAASVVRGGGARRPRRTGARAALPPLGRSPHHLLRRGPAPRSVVTTRPLALPGGLPRLPHPTASPDEDEGAGVL